VRVVVQRVSSATVSVAGEVVGACGPGLVVLVGIATGDTGATVDRMAAKVARLRIFENGEGRFDRSVVEVGGGALVVSQFTLIAVTEKGNRPSFVGAEQPEVAQQLIERFAEGLAREGVPVASGRFGARMAVDLVNDGPVTIVLDA
jgi:D-aminoacyl-tRNA deacylase